MTERKGKDMKTAGKTPDGGMEVHMVTQIVRDDGGRKVSAEILGAWIDPERAREVLAGRAGKYLKEDGGTWRVSRQEPDCRFLTGGKDGKSIEIRCDTIRME